MMTDAAKAVNHIADQLAACESHAHALAVERDGALGQLAEALEREQALMLGPLRGLFDERDRLIQENERFKNLNVILSEQQDQKNEEIERLNTLNEDKFRTIQAYCKAADEDRARIRRLVELLRDSLRDWRHGSIFGVSWSDRWDQIEAAIIEAEEWDRGRS